MTKQLTLIQVHVAAGDEAAGSAGHSAALAAALKGRRMRRRERRQEGEVAGAQGSGCHESRGAQRNDVPTQDIDRWVVLQPSLHESNAHVRQLPGCQDSICVRVAEDGTK